MAIIYNKMSSIETLKWKEIQMYEQKNTFTIFIANGYGCRLAGPCAPATQFKSNKSKWFKLQ